MMKKQAKPAVKKQVPTIKKNAPLHPLHDVMKKCDGLEQDWVRRDIESNQFEMVLRYLLAVGFEVEAQAVRDHVKGLENGK
jgi:hypothetical protein